MDIPDKGKDNILTKTDSELGRPREGAKGVCWMRHYSLLSGLECARHVHSDPFDLEWKNFAMNIREKIEDEHMI
jgi:hypothetical protein